VDDYLQAELDHKRIAGPFLPSQYQGVHITRFGVIPKGHQPNKWQLIVDLSHPSGCSVNDLIPKSLCSPSYITVYDAIQNILKYGQHTILAKVNIKSAFRLVPLINTCWAFSGSSRYMLTVVCFLVYAQPPSCSTTWQI